MRAIQPFPLAIPGTATLTIVLFRATRPGRLKAAAWVQTGAVDGTKTVKVQNLTLGIDLTAALAINGIAANGGADLVLANPYTGWRKGDVVALVYTVTVAGAVAPGQSTVELETQHGVSGEVKDP